MKAFSVSSDGQFTEFHQAPFQKDHNEKLLEDWLESNPGCILEDEPVLLIGRQVATNLNGYIDLMGIDRNGDVVVIELKRDRTPREVIAQALEYASYAEKLDSRQLEKILSMYQQDESLKLEDYHREFFSLAMDESVSFNKDQRIVIVGQKITAEIRQMATFLCSKGIRVTCNEFAFFETDEKTILLTFDTVVGKAEEKAESVSSGSLPAVTEKDFLASADNNGKLLFSRILEMAKSRNMPIHWGTKGFSLNADVEGTHIAICYAYPPDSVYKQTLRTTVFSNVARKTELPADVVDSLMEQLDLIDCFTPAGQEKKCEIVRKLTEKEVDSIVEWCMHVQEEIQKYGLKK